MIRSNWSLASELRKTEKKQQSKVQKRQKHQHKLEKLSDADPQKLFYRIRRLENTPDLPESQQKYLNDLKEDWKFIVKHGLHSLKVQEILKKDEVESKAREKAERKLWGNRSIYFNPELNPLGKVPKLKEDIQIAALPNLTKPLKSSTSYPDDPVLEELSIVLPEGEPPRFYKLVQNTEKPTEKPNMSKPDQLEKGMMPSGMGDQKRSKLLQRDSADEFKPVDTHDYPKKRRRHS